MNVLTKAFVVVVTILAVIMVALVVPFAARVPDYAQKYQDMKLDRDAKLEASSAVAAEARSALAAKGVELEEVQKQLQALSEKFALSKADQTALQTELAQAENTMSRNSAALEVLIRDNQVKGQQIADQAAVIQSNIETIGEQKGQMADLGQTVISLRADNRRLSDNYLNIQEQNKALQTQLSEASAKYKTLYDSYLALGGTDDKIDSTPSPLVRIEGSVTSIDQVGDGMTFVQLNVGTRDKVQKGMEFTVFRGDKFVGKIEITELDTAEAVGRLTLGSGVQEGDAVRAGNR